MTKEQAIARLIVTRELSTDLLEPLGISFEQWLQFSQLSKEQSAQIVSGLIAHYSEK